MKHARWVTENTGKVGGHVATTINGAECHRHTRQMHFSDDIHHTKTAAAAADAAAASLCSLIALGCRPAALASSVDESAGMDGQTILSGVPRVWPLAKLQCVH